MTTLCGLVSRWERTAATIRGRATPGNGDVSRSVAVAVEQCARDLRGLIGVMPSDPPPPVEPSVPPPTLPSGGAP